MTVRELPKVKIGDKLYYQDDWLEEFRAVGNPHDRISFDGLKYLCFRVFGYCPYGVNLMPKSYLKNR